MPKGNSESDELFERYPLRIAHRGASGETPENTALAIHTAIEKYEVDLVEMDLRLTRDGIPVVLHDATLDRTTNGKGAVRNYSLAELRAFDAGFRFDPEGKGTFPYRGKGITIPTLEEVLTRFSEASLCLEIKEKEVEIVGKVLDLLHRIPRKGKIMLASADGKIRRAVRKEAPADLPVLLAEEDVIWAFCIFRLGLKNFSPPSCYASLPTVQYGIRLDSKEWIEFLHRSGVRVFYWTANETSEMKRLLERGADGIVTDYSDRLNKILGR